MIAVFIFLLRIVFCVAETGSFFSTMVLLTREVLAVLVRPPCFFFGFLFLVVTAGVGLFKGFVIRPVLTELTVLCLVFFLEGTEVLLEVLILLTTGEVFLGLTVRLDFALGRFVTTVRTMFLEELFFLTAAPVFLDLAVRFDFAFGRFVTTVRTVLLEELFLLTADEVFLDLAVRLDFTCGRFVTTVRFDFAFGRLVTTARFEVTVLARRVLDLGVCLRFDWGAVLTVRDLLFLDASGRAALCFLESECLRDFEAAGFCSTF